MSETNGIVVRPSQPNGLTLSLSGEGKSVLHSLTLTEPSHQASFIEALNGEPDSLGDMIGKTIYISNALVHVVDMVSDKTGEVTKCVRTVLFTAAGKPYSAVSQGIYDSLQTLCMIAGPLPWSPPRAIQVSQRNLKSGKRWYYLTFADEDTQPPANGGGARKGGK